MPAEARTFRARFCARRREVDVARERIWSISYPASRSDAARALAKFPAPTMVMRGLADRFPAMPGRIAEVRTPAGSLFYIVLMAKSPNLKLKDSKSKARN